MTAADTKAVPTRTTSRRKCSVGLALTNLSGKELRGFEVVLSEAGKYSATDVVLAARSLGQPIAYQQIGIHRRQLCGCFS